jgi:hypothetical protein
MKSIKFSVLLLSFMTLTSCMTTKTSVGTYKEEQGKEYTYDKGKQFWLFWGLVPLGRTNVSTPTDGSCQITTKFRGIDVVISTLTGGIVTCYSIKVEDKKSE